MIYQYIITIPLITIWMLVFTISFWWSGSGRCRSNHRRTG